MSKNIKERIAELQNEQDQLKKRAQRLQSQFNKMEKKTTDRRKYVVGATILKDIESNEPLRKYVTRLLASAQERDKKLFPDLLPIVPSTSTPSN